MANQTYINRVADHYRRDGYRVRVGPPPDQLPPFLGTFRPDVIADGNVDHVVVAVRSRQELASDADLAFAATAIGSESGWRLDVIVGGEDDWTEPWADDAAEPTPAEVEAMLRTARRLSAAGEFGPAYLIGWAATEAALRAVAKANRLSASTRDPSAVIHVLNFEGLLDDHDVGRLDSAMATCNALSHGLMTSTATEGTLITLLDVAGRLTRAMARPAA